MLYSLIDRHCWCVELPFVVSKLQIPTVGKGVPTRNRTQETGWPRDRGNLETKAATPSPLLWQLIYSSCILSRSRGFCRKHGTGRSGDHNANVCGLQMPTGVSVWFWFQIFIHYLKGCPKNCLMHVRYPESGSTLIHNVFGVPSHSRLHMCVESAVWTGD